MITDSNEIKTDTGEIYNTKNIVIRILAHKFINRIESILQDCNVYDLKGLDIGTAEGQLLSILLTNKKINNIYSIELERRKIQKSCLAKYNHPFVQGDAQTLCFKDDSFDYVMATEILEHLPNPEFALAEICRVAKPKALIIISVPYEPFFHYGNLLRGKHLKHGGRTPSHLHFWHKKEFFMLLDQYFVIKKSYSIVTFPWLLYYCINR